MVKLYFDVETYRPQDRGAFTEEKVIAIGALEERAPHEEASFKLFTEWEAGSEKAAVGEFYRYLKALTGNGRVIVVGYNILRFDIPLLVQKGVEHGVGSLPELNKLWYNTYMIDLFQLTLPLNNMMFYGHSLEKLGEKTRSINPDIPKPYGRGADVAKLYEEGKYGEIEEHLKRDLDTIRAIDTYLVALIRAKLHPLALRHDSRKSQNEK